MCVCVCTHIHNFCFLKPNIVNAMVFHVFKQTSLTETVNNSSFPNNRHFGDFQFVITQVL